jgi:hypothetical protein
MAGRVRERVRIRSAARIHAAHRRDAADYGAQLISS